VDIVRAVVLSAFAGISHSCFHWCVQTRSVAIICIEGSVALTPSISYRKIFRCG
jgi:hypothetical protein